MYILLRKLISERITETRSKIYRATLSFAMNKTGWNAFMYTMQRIAPLNDQLLVGVSLNGIIIQIKSEWAPTMTYKRS